MSKKTLLLFMSRYTPKWRDENAHERGFSAPQTNETVVRYLMNRKDTAPNRIIALCTESVRTPGNTILGKSTLDYFTQDFLPKLPGKPELLPIAVPDHMDEASRATAIREIVKLIDREDTLYIDLSGGMRDTAMLLVTIARYLQEILGVSTEKVLYTEMGDSLKVQDSTHLYELFDLISAVDLFFTTGSVQKLQLFRFGRKTTAVDTLLKEMHRFSEHLALCSAGYFKKDIQNIAKALRAHSDRSDDLTEFLFQIMQVRFGEELEPLLGREKDGLPYQVEWCIRHQLYQQALTLLCEEMPEFLCRHIDFRLTAQAEDYIMAQEACKRLSFGDAYWWSTPVFHYYFSKMVFFHDYNGFKGKSEYFLRDLRKNN